MWENRRLTSQGAILLTVASMTVGFLRFSFFTQVRCNFLLPHAVCLYTVARASTDTKHTSYDSVLCAIQHRRRAVKKERDCTHRFVWSESHTYCRVNCRCRCSTDRTHLARTRWSLTTLFCWHTAKITLFVINYPPAASQSRVLFMTSAQKQNATQVRVHIIMGDRNYKWVFFSEHSEKKHDTISS